MSFLGSQLDEYVGSAIDPDIEDADDREEEEAKERKQAGSKQGWQLQLNPLHAKGRASSARFEIGSFQEAASPASAKDSEDRVSARRGGRAALYPADQQASSRSKQEKQSKERSRHSSSGPTRASKDRRLCGRCRRWLRHHGRRGLVAVLMMCVTLIYLVVLFVMHTVTNKNVPLSLDALMDAPDVKEWIGITQGVSVCSGIAIGILFVRGTLLLVDMTCRSTKYNRKSLRKFTKARTNLRSRVVHCYRSWFGPTGPWFQWKEFIKDVQEFALQGWAMYNITASGVSASWLAALTAVIFVNSTFEPFFLHFRVRKERRMTEASDLKWVLVIGGLCELYYGIWPLVLLFVQYEYVSSEAGKRWYCGGDEDGQGRSAHCQERYEGILCLMGQDSMLGSFSWAEVAQKFLTRLLPIYFAMSRFRAVVMLDALYVARLAHPQTRSLNSTEMKGAIAEAKRAVSASIGDEGSGGGGGDGGGGGISVPKPKGNDDKANGTTTTTTATRPAKPKKTALQRLHSMVSQRWALQQQRKEVPKILVGSYMAFSAGFCIFVWIRLALISSVCYANDAPGDWIGRNGFPPLCKTPTFAVFSFSGLACPCHTFIADDYGTDESQSQSDCGKNSTMEDIYRRYLDDTSGLHVAAEYGRILALHECAFNATHLANIVTDFTRLQVLELVHPLHDPTGGGSGDMAKVVADGIGRLTSLRFIFIDGIGLTSLPEGFRSAQRLTLVHLHDNVITSLPPVLADILPVVRHVALTNNRIGGILDVELPPSITYFRLNENLLEGVSDRTFGPHLAHLFSVGLEKQGSGGGTTNPSGGLRNMSASVFTLPSLERLYVFQNELTQLADRVQLDAIPEGQLSPVLWRIEARKNRITSLPAAFLGRITGLKRFDFSTNAMTSIPPSVGRLTKLEQVSLNANELGTIPSALWALPKLEFLDLAQNNITSTGTVDLSQIQLPRDRLNLDENPICLTEPMADGRRPAVVDCKSECAPGCNIVNWDAVGRSDMRRNGRCDTSCNTSTCDMDGNACQ